MTAPAALIVADWNLPLAEVERIAERVKGVVMVGHAVDHAVLVDAKPLGVLRLGLHGSDAHQALVFTFALPDETRVRVLWWNVWVGQDPDVVAREVSTMADRHQPHIIGLCEAYRCRTALGTVPGYRRFQGIRLGASQHSENADVALLVRRDLKVRVQAAARMRIGWIGPKHGTRKGPRVYRRAWLEFPGGQQLRVLAAHLPTGGTDGPNENAVLESLSRIVRWVKR